MAQHGKNNNMRGNDGSRPTLAPSAQTSERAKKASMQASKALKSGTTAAKSTAWGVAGVAVDVMKKSRVALLVFIVAVLLLLAALLDGAVNFGKAYAGVSVGGVDVGGMNEQQIGEAVEKEFATRLKSAGVIIYANEDAKAQGAMPEEQIINEASDPYATEEEVPPLAWAANADTLQAEIDVESLSQDALNVGRTGILDRLSLFFSSVDIPVSINYNDAIVESLAKEIDESVGSPLENYGIAIEYGVASVTPGHDGNMVNRNTLKNKLTEQFLSTEASERSVVAELEHTAVQVDEAAASAAAEKVNGAISNGIRFSGIDSEWLAEPYEVGEWIQAVPSQTKDGSWALNPSLSFQLARSAVLQHIQPRFENGEGHVKFSKDAAGVTVTPTSSGLFPNVGEAIEALNLALFTTGAKAPENVTIQNDGPVLVQLNSSDIPSSMTVSEALSSGIITTISEFTTSYTPGEENRNHNIHLAADLLNNSIVTANGGTWGFNDTAGECNEEKGFKSAGVINPVFSDDDIGGGICQVATTVFNAVFDAGYPILERHNHTAYISSYPQGRDAAISWPAPDLKWENDTSSDVLLVMSYTDTTVTATLYGEVTGYEVQSEVSEATEGAAYTTVYQDDDTLSAGVEYYKSYGSNGFSVTVTRQVFDSEGTLIRTDVFPSGYAAQNAVIVRGTATY